MHVLIRLLLLLRPYKRRVFLAWLCLTASGGFVLLTPLIIQWALDFGVGVTLEAGQLAVNFDGRLLLLASIAILASAGARGIFAFGQQYLGEWIGQRVAYDLRNRIYDRLQHLSYAYHDT